MVFGLIRLIPVAFRFIPKAAKAFKPLFVGKTPIGTFFKSTGTLSTGAFVAGSPTTQTFLKKRITQPFSLGSGLATKFETGLRAVEIERSVIKVPQSLNPNITLLSGRTATATPSGQLLRSEPIARFPILGKIKEVVTSPSFLIPAAIGTGAAVLGSTLLGRIKDTKIPAGAILPTGAIQPLGAVEKPEVKEKEVPKAIMPSIKNTFNPEINISFKKSKKFINQQVFVR